MKSIIILAILSVNLYLHSLGQLSETWEEYKSKISQRRKSQQVKTELSSDIEKVRSRKKRNVGFPTGSKFTITPVLCIPVVEFGDVSSYLEIELPFTINLPNATQYTHSFFARSNEDRSGIFSVIIKSLERLGLNGRACLMRAICEISETPLQNDGLLGEVVNIILRSSTVREPSMKEFAEAEYYGRSYGNCWSMYSQCPISLFRLIHDGH